MCCIHGRIADGRWCHDVSADSGAEVLAGGNCAAGGADARFSDSLAASSAGLALMNARTAG
jgi:hypothetical protein